jgi:hypothetical protein
MATIVAYIMPTMMALYMASIVAYIMTRMIAIKMASVLSPESPLCGLYSGLYNDQNDSSVYGLE